MRFKKGDTVKITGTNLAPYQIKYFGKTTKIISVKNDELYYLDIDEGVWEWFEGDLTLVSIGSVQKLKDSGERQSFTTGSVRDLNTDKGRFDLIPSQVMFRLAKHYEAGSKKYGDRNWELGQPISRCYDSARRHLEKYLDGWNDEDHLAAAVWNISAIMQFERDKKEMQDLPTRIGIENPYVVEKEML